MTERVYVVQRGDETVGYVGRTRRALSARMKEHLAATATLTTKPFIDALRYDTDSWHIELLEESDTASEEEWRQRLLNEGWTLFNATSGNAKPAKARDTEAERTKRELLAGSVKRDEAYFANRTHAEAIAEGDRLYELMFRYLNAAEKCNAAA